MKNRSRPEYRVWAGMWTRCTNKNERAFKYYGQRGIKVCERWKSFEMFFADMGERPKGYTIGRIDNDKDYSPENCRWESVKEQARNKSNNRLIEYKGETKTLAEWSEETGIGHATIINRLKSEWTIAEALGFEEKKWNRKHKRVLFEYNGEKKHLPEWAEQYGINRSTLAQRIYGLGWDIDKAINFRRK